MIERLAAWTLERLAVGKMFANFHGGASMMAAL
jgi:hypothetical protein